jgi:vancomycin permeability regulator SanA
MIDRVIQFIYRGVWFAIFTFLLTAGVIVADGLRNSGEHADLAIVPGHAEIESGDPWVNVQARLDKAIELYQANKFSTILVSGAEKTTDYYEAGAMVQYLEGKGIPSSAIIGDEGGPDTQEMAIRWAAKIKEHNFTSVMLVTNYYQITRLKVALWQQPSGASIAQAHVGGLQAADALDIAREDVAFYRYLGKHYLGPSWRHFRSKAAKVKHAVDAWFDSLVK